MTTLKLSNTATRRKEEFVPRVPGQASLYTCGPTVHDYAHIGNFRTFVFFDVLSRVLRRLGFTVHHVMNLTDVEDRIIRKAGEAGLTIRDFTERYVQAFHEDRRALRIDDAEVYPLATDHVPEMVTIIEGLERNGHTYRADGSVYFRVASFPAYGALSGVDLAGQLAGSRVDADEYDKRDVQDFVLWKAARPGEPSWETPFGPGRPGWHIECSAMAMRYLGETFDIHAGAIDLIFPHHENEIAQSEGATGKPFARYWLHAEFLNVSGDKMSKRLGNFHTLRDLVAEGVPPRALRYAYLTCHYKKPMTYGSDTIPQAMAALERIDNTMRRLHTEARPGAAGPAAEAIARAVRDFDLALADDLSTPLALAALHGLVSELNAAMDRASLTAGDRDLALAALAEFDTVLAVIETPTDEAPRDLARLMSEREAARERRDWAEADRLRQAAETLGYALEDVKGGQTRWRKL